MLQLAKITFFFIMKYCLLSVKKFALTGTNYQYTNDNMSFIISGYFTSSFLTGA